MKILVVEDDLMMADLLCDDLERQGHEVCGVASTVAEGVELALRHRPDIGVFDVQLKDGERGPDIAAALGRMANGPWLGILYVTGHSGSLADDRWASSACLRKPYTSRALAAALDIVMDIKTHGSTSRPLPPGLRILDHAAPPPSRHQRMGWIAADSPWPAE